MNFTPFKTYNNQSFNVALSVYPSDITLTSPSMIKKDQKTVIAIPAQNITYIMFQNSIVNIIPTARIQIIDNGFILTKKLRTQNIRFNLQITKDGGNGPQNIVYDMMWIVKSFNILNISMDSIQYSIQCQLDCSIPLNTLCLYATSKDLHSNQYDGSQNPLMIARSILTQVGFPLYPEGKKDDEGNYIKNRYSLPKCSNYIDFITNHNMTALEAVKYLMAKSVGNFDIQPPPYLIFNIKDNKGFITTRAHLFDDQYIKQQPDTSMIPFSFSSFGIGRQHQMRDVKTDPFIDNAGGINNSKLFFNYQFYHYIHNDRLWENYKATKFNINDALTKGSNPANTQSLYLKSGDEDLQLSKYYQSPFIDQQSLYDVLRNLQLFSSNLQFTVDGDLNLDAGQVINVVQTDDSYSKYQQFSGKWLITAIRHSFKNKEYKINMVCSRTYNSKALC